MVCAPRLGETGVFFAKSKDGYLGTPPHRGRPCVVYIYTVQTARRKLEMKSDPDAVAPVAATAAARQLYAVLMTPFSMIRLGKGGENTGWPPARDARIKSSFDDARSLRSPSSTRPLLCCFGCACRCCLVCRQGVAAHHHVCGVLMAVALFTAAAAGAFIFSTPRRRPSGCSRPGPGSATCARARAPRQTRGGSWPARPRSPPCPWRRSRGSA